MIGKISVCGLTADGQLVTLLLNEDGSLASGSSGDGDGGNTSTTAITNSIPASTSSVTLLAEDSTRKGATFYNDSTATLYLKLGTGAASNSFTTKLLQDDYYELPTGYTGSVSGVWDSAVGSLYITELT